jgi:hypothetical protein
VTRLRVFLNTNGQGELRAYDGEGTMYADDDGDQMGNVTAQAAGMVMDEGEGEEEPFGDDSEMMGQD